MAVNIDVPFYSNTPDDTHCVQACYRMVLKYFFPEREYSWKELETATAEQEGMWTWPMAGLCWLKELGFEVVYIEDFDYTKFLAKKKDYLVEKYGQQIADEQEKHSNIEAELKWARKFIDTIKTDNRVPDVDQIKWYLDRKYLIIVSVNYNSLHEKDGYTGHSVVVKGYSNKHLMLHDPGNPGIENFRVTQDQFIKGWSFPDKFANNITALRLQ